MTRNCIVSPQNLHGEVLTFKVTIFEDIAFKELTKLKQVIRVRLSYLGRNSILVRRGRDTRVLL
jgi:hypothetical protein